MCAQIMLAERELAKRNRQWNMIRKEMRSDPDFFVARYWLVEEEANKIGAYLTELDNGKLQSFLSRNGVVWKVGDFLAKYKAGELDGGAGVYFETGNGERLVSLILGSKRGSVPAIVSLGSTAYSGMRSMPPVYFVTEKTQVAIHAKRGRRKL